MQFCLKYIELARGSGVCKEAVFEVENAKTARSAANDFLKKRKAHYKERRGRRIEISLYPVHRYGNMSHEVVMAILTEEYPH